MRKIIIEVTEKEFKRYNPKFKGEPNDMEMHLFTQMVEEHILQAIENESPRMYGSIYIAE